MPLEIERKFLVRSDDWRAARQSERYLKQFYLTMDGRCSVRVRIAPGKQAWLTVKSAVSGMTRSEFEYSIPIDDAEEMAALADGSVIEKTRHQLDHGGLEWVVDEFAGENQGLIVAEVELTSEDQCLDLPGWVGEEVTHDQRYFNASLARKPFKRW